MKVTNLSVTSFLVKEEGKRFKIDGRAMLKEAPDWVMTNQYALKLREKGKLSFEVKAIPKTKKEQLNVRATELGIVFGDNITEATLEKKIEEKEKELQDDDKK